MRQHVQGMAHGLSNVSGNRTDPSNQLELEWIWLKMTDSLCIRCFDEPSNYTMHRMFENTLDVMYIFVSPVDPVNMFELYKEFSVDDCVCHVRGFSQKGSSGDRRYFSHIWQEMSCCMTGSNRYNHDPWKSRQPWSGSTRSWVFGFPIHTSANDEIVGGCNNVGSESYDSRWTRKFR